VLARVGIRLLLPASFSELQYYGRGPHENYCDRNTSAAVDLYTSSVKDQFVTHIRPGECGAKTDIRWLELSDPIRHVTLSCASAEPFTFSSHRLLPEDMAVRHPGKRLTSAY
jgi:beta-galactosidase